MNERLTRSKWFVESRFGMFIHWGLYAIPARGEWVRANERISVADYQPYFDSFDPIDYDPKAWARAAKQAGMKYAVMTAKHHDGFCLFDSKLTDYKATNTKAGRDLVREYVEAFRAEGLKVGLYYSLLDWHHPDYPHFSDRIHPMRGNAAYESMDHNWDNYLDYFHGQVRELLTGYGKLDLMWFDFSYGEMSCEKWKAKELVEMMRSLQPHILIDNRLEAAGEHIGSLATKDPTPWSGDFASPEQIIPPEGLRNEVGDPIPWESCITMNRHWGYCAGDTDFKNATLCVRKLVECVSKGGNLLLNVGPDAKGNIPAESLNILRGIGDWMARNSDSIYGCGRAELEKPEWGRYTRNGNKVYGHVTEAPIGALPLYGISAEEIGSMRLLSDGSEIKMSKAWMTGMYKSVSFADFDNISRDCTLPDPVDTVFEITLKG